MGACQSSRGIIEPGKAVQYAGMYSKGRFTGDMPGDVQEDLDGINAKILADLNVMRINEENIISKRNKTMR